MRRFLVTLTLTCVLSVSAFAAEIPTCGVTAPAPEQTPETTQPGNIPTGDFEAVGHIDTCGLSVVMTLFDLAF